MPGRVAAVELSKRSVKRIERAVYKGTRRALEDAWSGTVEVDHLGASAFMDIVEAVKRAHEELEAEGATEGGDDPAS